MKHKYLRYSTVFTTFIFNCFFYFNIQGTSNEVPLGLSYYLRGSALNTPHSCASFLQKHRGF